MTAKCDDKGLCKKLNSKERIDELPSCKFYYFFLINNKY
jgi:hypothetical protein